MHAIKVAVTITAVGAPDRADAACAVGLPQRTRARLLNTENTAMSTS